MVERRHDDRVGRKISVSTDRSDTEAPPCIPGWVIRSDHTVDPDDGSFAPVTRSAALSTPADIFQRHIRPFLPEPDG